MMEQNKQITIATHNGSFHADDLFACATLKLLYSDATIIRTRDQALLDPADIVLDIGGVYDPEKKRFDHHQKGGAGIRENGILYASFGLIWKHFGMQLCNDDKEVWQKIENKIVIPQDAIDTGTQIVQKTFGGLSPYFGDQVFLSFSPTWKEGDEHIDDIFRTQVERAAPVLAREIKVAKDDIEGERFILNAPRENGIVMMDMAMPRYLYQNLLCKIPDVNFILLKSEKNGWKVECIRKNESTMESRIPFPQTWAGLGGAELQKVSGIATITGCHNGRFIIWADTKEDAIKAVEIAMQN